MRATILSRAPRRRGLITGLVTASVLTLSLFAGGTALGANPNWIVGHGTDSAPTAPQPDSGASSSAVGAGRQVGFFEWLRNGDTSNISQLYLTASTTPSATVAGATWTIKNAAGATVGTGVCPTATPLTCSFGALNAGNTVYVVAAFTTPSTLADGAMQAVHFEFNTTGTPGGKNNSHGDAKAIDDQVDGHQQRRRQRRLQPRPGQPHGRRQPDPAEQQEPAGDVRDGQCHRGRSGGR